MFMTKVDRMLAFPRTAVLLATACLCWTEAAYSQVPGKGPGAGGGGQALAQPAEGQGAPQGPGGSSSRAGKGSSGRGGGFPGGGAGAGAPGMMPGMGPAMSPAEPNSVAEMLSVALQANPDLLVARAKVAEAEAELRRVQLDVARRVIRQRQEIENQKSKVARIEKLHASKAVAPEELSEAVNELSALQTELQYLLGRSPEVAGGPSSMGAPGMMGMSGIPSMMMPGMMPGRPGMSGPGGEPPAASKAAPGAGRSSDPVGKGDEKISKALQTKISLKLENAPLHDVLKKLQELADVKFVINTARLSQAGVPLDTPVTVDVDEIPLGSVLQLIEDLHPPIGFTVRDYGILVSEGPVNPRESMMNMMRSLRGR